MLSMNSPLFEQFEIAGMSLRNRVVMAPLTRSRAPPDGKPTDLMAEYYSQRSEAGLIVSEATNISPAGQGFLNIPGIFNEAHVDGWRHVVDRVHHDGGRFILQLWHVGRIAHPDNMGPGLHPVAPSAIVFDRTIETAKGHQPTQAPRELSLGEVRQTIHDYARASRLAVQAGCDGVEIHAANGFLPSQFLHESTNRRTDAYGGDIARRARFVVETAEECVASIGARRVGIRFSPFSTFNGATSSDECDLYRYLIQELARLNLGYLHVVSAEISGEQTIERDSGTAHPDAVGLARKLWPFVLIGCGSYDLARADADIRTNRADMIAFGRDFISNPDLVTRLREGRPLAQRSPSEWYGGGAQGYTDYPRWSAQVSGK
jgi:N-ethylmaleimide reductase